MSVKLVVSTERANMRYIPDGREHRRQAGAVPMSDRGGESGVFLVNDVCDIGIVDDRLQFTLVSGRRSRTYSLTKHRARNSIAKAIAALDAEDRRQSSITAFPGDLPKQGRPPKHG